MKKTRFGLCLALACALPAAHLLAAAGQPATAGYDKLKALVGDWEGKGPDGSPVTMSYSLVADGSALMERLSVGNMVTMYHLDGGQLMLTHYCAGGNQPRMKSPGISQDGKTLDFKFAGATNLPKPTDMHMHDLKVTFMDADHITQEWVHAIGDKRDPMTIAWQRKR